MVALGLGTKRHWHILVAIIMGMALGLAFPVEHTGVTFLHQFFDVVGQFFIRLIQMIVIPLVVSSLIVGVSSLGDSRHLGRMGGKVLVFFLLLMMLSSILGAMLALLMEPGTQLQAEILRVAGAARENVAQLIAARPSLEEIFYSLIPVNPLASLASSPPQLVPVILFTLLFGVAVASIGDAGKPVVTFF